MLMVVERSSAGTLATSSNAFANAMGKQGANVRPHDDKRSLLAALGGRFTVRQEGPTVQEHTGPCDANKERSGEQSAIMSGRASQLAYDDAGIKGDGQEPGIAMGAARNVADCRCQMGERQGENSDTDSKKHGSAYPSASREQFARPVGSIEGNGRDASSHNNGDCCAGARDGCRLDSAASSGAERSYVAGHGPTLVLW